MPLLRTGLAAALAAISVLSCSTSLAYTWRDDDFAALPVGGLAGHRIWILPVMDLSAAPGVEDDGAVGPGARTRADSVIAATLQRRVPASSWVPAAEVRARAEADRTLPHPDSMPMHLLQLRALMSVPQKLLDQMRALVASDQGRYIFVPARLTYRVTSNRRARVEATVLLIDTKLGVAVTKSDVSGEDATSLGALTATIRALTNPR